MGPQHVRVAQPSAKKCMEARCPELKKERAGSKIMKICELTDRVPGKMIECPLEHGKHCPKLRGCPLLRTGMTCSQCLNTMSHTKGWT